MDSTPLFLIRTSKNNATGAPMSNLKDRFMAKVKIDTSESNACWLWTASSRGVGYGCIKVDGKVKDAHIVSHEIFTGPVPKGMVVMHTCDNRLCVNPEHLKIGTYQENHLDAIAKGRLKPWKRTRVEPLTDAEIETIRDDFCRGVSCRVLCTKYKVAPTSLGRLLKDLK